MNGDPIDVAGRAILRFCVDEGGYNGFEAGVMVCVTFLNEVMPSPPTGAARPQALKDLSTLLKSPPTSSLKRWSRAIMSE